MGQFVRIVSYVVIPLGSGLILYLCFVLSLDFLLARFLLPRRKLLATLQIRNVAISTHYLRVN